MPVASARPSAGENVNLRRGPCQHGTFTVTRGFDKVSSKLFDAAAAGVVFEDALIFLCSMMGGSKNESHGPDSLLTIHLTNAIMTSFQYSYSSDWPIEVIGFSYTSIFWDVAWPDPVDGKVNDMEQAGWDGLLNKSGTLAIPGSLDFEDAT
jgi:type VI protein secretion system component Hcp